MNLKNFKITNRGLYWGLIVTFAILYLCVGFVSTLHSITFFHLANNIGLAVLLGLTYEVGQASVLFSILMSEKNQGKFLPWFLMVLLTALQVTANVYASFKFMATSGSTDWTYWQKSILFFVQAPNPEMYQVIISWIAGALLPIVALGMTALVAQNMNFMKEENEKPKEPDVKITDVKAEQQLTYNSNEKAFVNTDVVPTREEQLESLKDKLVANTVSTMSEREQHAPIDKESGLAVIQKPIQINLQDVDGNYVSTPSQKEIDEIIENEVQKRMADIPLQTLIEKYKSQNNSQEISAIIDDGGISNELDVAGKFEKEGQPEPELEKATKDATEEMSKYAEETRVDVMDDLDRDVIALTPEFPGKYEQKFPGLTQTMKEIYEEIATEEIIPVIPMNAPDGTGLLSAMDVITEPPKKRGRPPKQKDDNVAEPKKEQELLPVEEVKVPEKQKRSVNPLKLKDKKIKPLKTLKEINKPSKGDEVIALIENLEKEKEKESISHLIADHETAQEALLVPPEVYASYITGNGVEVIDAKAIAKVEAKKKHEPQVDKFGIPIHPNEHKNFDRI